MIVEILKEFVWCFILLSCGGLLGFVHAVRVERKENLRRKSAFLLLTETSGNWRSLVGTVKIASMNSGQKVISFRVAPFAAAAEGQGAAAGSGTINESPTETGGL